MRGLVSCELCPPELQDLFYLDERDLMLHKAIKHERVRPISCNLCSAKIGDPTEFNLHMKNFHKRCSTHVRCYRNRCFKIVSMDHLSEHYKSFHPLLEQLDFQSGNIGETIALFGLIENNFVATRYHCFDCSRDFICSSLIECNLCANEPNPNVYAAFVKILDFILHLQKDHGLKFNGMLACPFKDSSCDFLGEVLQVSEHVERSHNSCRMHICCSPQCTILLSVSNYSNAHFKPEECQYLEGSNEAFTTYLRHNSNSKPLKVGHIKAADLKGEQNSKSKSVLYFQKNPAEIGKLFYASVLKCPVPKVDYDTKFFAYNCTTCAFVFQLPPDSKLIHHSCPFCHSVFFSLIEAKAHVASCHRYAETNAKNKCTECELTADSSEKVIRHRVAAHSLCKEHLLCVSNKGCKNLFKTFRQLSRHLTANECKGQIRTSENEKQAGSLTALDNVYKCTSCSFCETLDARNFVECSQCNDHSPVFLVSEVDLSVHNYLRDQLDVDEMILLQCFKKECPPKWLRLLEYFVHRDQTHNFCSLHFVCHFKDCRTLMPSLHSLLLHQVTCQKRDRGRREEDIESKNANSELQKMICSYSQSLKLIRPEKYACRFCNEVFESTMLFFCKLCPFDVSPILFVDATEFLFHLALFHKIKCEIELECNLPLRDNVPCKVSGKVQDILKHRIMNHNICAVHIKCPFRDCNFLFDNVDDVLSHRTGSGHLEMLKPVLKFTRQESSKSWRKNDLVESFSVISEKFQVLGKNTAVPSAQVDRNDRSRIQDRTVIGKVSETRTPRSPPVGDHVLSSPSATKVRQVSNSAAVEPSRSPIKRQSFASPVKDDFRNGNLGSRDSTAPRQLSPQQTPLVTPIDLHNPKTFSEVPATKMLAIGADESFARDPKPLVSETSLKEHVYLSIDARENVPLLNNISKTRVSEDTRKESPIPSQSPFPGGREESLEIWKRNINIPVSRARAPFPRIVSDRSNDPKETSIAHVPLKPQESVSTTLRHDTSELSPKALNLQNQHLMNGPVSNVNRRGTESTAESRVQTKKSTQLALVSIGVGFPGDKVSGPVGSAGDKFSGPAVFPGDQVSKPVGYSGGKDSGPVVVLADSKVAGSVSFAGDKASGSVGFPGDKVSGPVGYSGNTVSGPAAYSGDKVSGTVTFPGDNKISGPIGFPVNQVLGRADFPVDKVSGPIGFPGDQVSKPVGYSGGKDSGPVVVLADSKVAGSVGFPGGKASGSVGFSGDKASGSVGFPGDKVSGPVGFPGCKVSGPVGFPGDKVSGSVDFLGDKISRQVGFPSNSKISCGNRNPSNVVGFIPHTGSSRPETAKGYLSFSSTAILPTKSNMTPNRIASAPAASIPINLSSGKLTVDYLDESDSSTVAHPGVDNKRDSTLSQPNETFNFIKSVRDFVSNEPDAEASENQLLQEGLFDSGPFVTDHEKSIYFGHFILLPVVTKSLIQAPPRVKFYICSRCGFRKDFASHDFVNHYICSVCDMAFMCELEATYHFCYSHNKEFPSLREDINCNFCRHSAGTLDEWINHRRLHHRFCVEHIVCMSSGCLSHNIFPSKEALFDHISRFGCLKKGRIQRIDRANSPYFAELLKTDDFLCQLTCIACNFSQYKVFDGMKAVTYAKCCANESFATSEDRNQHLAALHHNSSGMLVQKLIQTCLNCKVQLPVLASMLHNVYNHVQCSEHYVCPNDSCMLLFPSPSLVSLHHKNCIMTFFTFKQKEILARTAVGPPNLPDVSGQWKKRAPKVEHKNISKQFRERSPPRNRERSPLRSEERFSVPPQERSSPRPRERSPRPGGRSPPRSRWSDREPSSKPEEDLQLDGFLAQLRSQTCSTRSDRSRDDSRRSRNESESSNRSERKRHRRSRSRDRKHSEESTASSIDDFLKQARYGDT